MERERYYTLPAVTRYYNHIQHLQPVNEARTLLRDTPFLLVEFDLDNMPPIERKVEVKEKKPKKEGAKVAENEGKKAKSADKAASPVTKSEDKPAASEDQPKKQKKEKKEKAPQPTESKKGKAAAEPAGPPMPSMIDLRVGKVLEGEKGTGLAAEIPGR
jgi:aminoacyl tRNA synthase complex-interacting multifunctional protein 1